MKKILFLLLFVSVVYPQNKKYVKNFILRYQTTNATVLNGTTQYWTKSSPSNLDLNSSEMISNANNTGFETNIGNWANFGNHSAVRSTVDKRTGTASMKITSSAAGDTTANFMYLPPSALGTIVSGNKYTIELWARSATATSTITINIGTQSATSGTLSTTFASFTKVVFNFTATAGSDTLKIYANKAIDSLYVDDVSLTQAYDAMIVLSFKSTMSGTARVVSTGSGAAGNMGYGLTTTATAFFTDFNDITTRVNPSSTCTPYDGLNHICVAVLDRTGNVTPYFDGVAGSPASATALGKIDATTYGLFLGRFAVSSAGFYGGNINFLQIVRFSSVPSSIAQTIIQISQQKKLLGAYTNGQIVAWYDWKSGGFDKSGNGNHLTPVASPQIVRIQK